MCPSHINVSLSSFSKINKHILRWDLKNLNIIDQLLHSFFEWEWGCGGYFKNKHKPDLINAI